MCGISGIYYSFGGMKEKEEKYERILRGMNKVLKSRGPDEEGIYIGDCCGFAHVRLSILDLKNGQQPMVYRDGDNEFVITYNGEIYNMEEIRNLLQKEGMRFETNCDTEVILKGYARWGIDIAQYLNGIFAFAIYDKKKKEMILCRDRLGVKPLYFTRQDNKVIFASEIKALLSYDKRLSLCNREGLCELLALGPAHSPQKSVYRDIRQVEPGCIYRFYQEECTVLSYWQLKGEEHKDNLTETIEKTSYLVKDAIRLQMLSDIEVCTFLSGGLDSSIVTSVAAGICKKEGKQLSTYSFDFDGNNEFFQGNTFQPSQDAPFALEMAEYLGTNHKILWCEKETLFYKLYDAMKARDYPSMSDVESSLIYFCGEVAKKHRVALTGECADEIFGGYPWFYRKDLFERDDFPWSYDMEARTALLKPELSETLSLKEYSYRAYRDTIDSTPVFEGDSGEEKRRRELMYLNIKWFMANLLERMDRTSMYHGLEARVPFADHRIVEYLYNVPWEFKYMGNMEKGLLRKASEGILPESVLYRKKSPYPKTYDPAYEALLRKAFKEILDNKEEPVNQLIDEKRVVSFLEGNLSYVKPWYGQLMAGPQLLAYYLQINMWLKEYNVKICI